MTKLGRPIKWDEKTIEKIRIKLDEYIEESDVPIISEFSYQNNISRQRLYEFANDYEEFSDTFKKCTTKKEAQLEKLGLLNIINPTMAIFSLKQLGWTDKQQIEHSGETTSNVKAEIKPSIDYSKLSSEELIQLESIINKSAQS